MALTIVPSIDLRGGRVVRLKQGDYARQVSYDVDPIATARSFKSAGATWMHIVDLDGAKEGKPVQTELIAKIIAACGLAVEAGGGIRTTDDVRQLLIAGAQRVVIGTKAIEDWSWFQSLAHNPEFANKLVLALDAKDGVVATRGWTHASGKLAVDIAREITDWPVAAILYTDVAKDGMLQGPNLAQTRLLAEAGNVPVIASGGVGNVQHIRQVRELPVWGVIVGRSLYEGTLDLTEAIRVAGGAMKLSAVYSSGNIALAQLVAEALRSHGVPAVVTDVQTSTLVGISAIVRVHEEHAKLARRIAKDFTARAFGEKQKDTPPWLCPGCGEEVEPQFTDCWNCQTPRPTVEHLPLPELPPDPEIQIDIVCLGCGYNLRGLRIDEVCPECGRLIIPSVTDLLGMVGLPVDADAPATKLRPCIFWFEQHFGISIETLSWVIGAWPRVLRASKRRDERSLAKALLEDAPKHTARRLKELNLDTSDKLGRLVAFMIELGIVSLR